MARSLASYRDVEAILDAILAREKFPATVTLPNVKAAARWAFRAHQMRRITREIEEARLNLPEGTGSSRFDHLKFSLNNNQVVVSVKLSEAVLEIDGQVVDPSTDEVNLKDEGIV